VLNHYFLKYSKSPPPYSNPQELRMATLVAMDVRPISTPHLDLDHLPLADRDFQIKDTSVIELLLKIHCQSRDNFLNHADKIGLWESNFPKYQFLQV